MVLRHQVSAINVTPRDNKCYATNVHDAMWRNMAQHVRKYALGFLDPDVRDIALLTEVLSNAIGIDVLGDVVHEQAGGHCVSQCNNLLALKGLQLEVCCKIGGDLAPVHAGAHNHKRIRLM